MWQTALNCKGCATASVPSLRGQRDWGKAWKTSEAERNAHQLRHTGKPQRRQPGTKDFPYSIILKRCAITECNILSICLIHQQRATKGDQTGSEWSERLKPGCTDWTGRAWNPSSAHGLEPRQHHTLQKGKSRFIVTTDNERRVTPSDTKGPDFCLMHNGSKKPQIHAVHSGIPGHHLQQVPPSVSGVALKTLWYLVIKCKS